MTEFSATAFGQGPLHIPVGSAVATFPRLSADVWLDRLARGTWVHETLAGGALPEDVLTLLEDGALTPHDLYELANRVLSAEGGRPWWEVERLAGAGSTPAMLGQLLLSGVDPARVRLSSYCAAVWALILQSSDETQRMQLEMEITMPPEQATDAEIAEAEGGDSPDQMVARLRSMPGVRVG